MPGTLEGSTVAPDLLLLSSSGVYGYPPFAFALDALAEIVGGARALHFAPFAAKNHDSYTTRVGELLAPLGVPVIGLHAVPDARAAIEEAEALFIGGGNSFRLLRSLQQQGLVEPIRRRVLAGALRFIGSSAGTNMACPSLRTTNDMPIVQPASFEAIGLVPFQINPHYQDADPDSTHRGETREQRIVEFIDENDVAVLGLREGCWLRRRGASLTLEGITGGRLFRRAEEPAEVEPGADLSWLLTLTPRFDTPA
jgi:dipeptidase E